MSESTTVERARADRPDTALEDTSVDRPVLPEAPPDPDWLGDEEVLHDWLEAAAEATHAQWRQAQQHVREAVEEPLRAVARHLADRHRQVLDQAAFTEQGVAPVVLWRRLTTYRQAVRDEVLVPLHRHLVQSSPAEAVGSAYLNMVDALAAQLQEAPDTLTIPEPSGLYDPDETDRVVRRMRKRWVLARRRIQRRVLWGRNRLRRLVRRPVQPGPAHSITVPFKRLLAYHLQVRVPQVLVPLHERQHQHLVRSMARLESAWTAWVQQVLNAEQALDHPAFHEPDAVDGPWFGDEPARPEPSEKEGGKKNEPSSAPAIPATLQADVQQAGEALQQALETVFVESADPGEAEAGFQDAAAVLAGEMRRGSTFLLDLNARAVPEEAAQPRTVLGQRAQVWDVWYGQVAHRAEVDVALLALRQGVVRLLDALVKHTAAATLRPVVGTLGPIIERLRATHDRVLQVCEHAATATAVAKLAETLHTLQAETMAYVQDTIGSVDALVAADQVLERPGEREEQDAREQIARMPEERVIHVPLAPPFEAIDPEGRTVRIDLRAFAAEAFALSLPDHLKPAAQKLRNEVIRVWSETEQIQNIIQYNLDAALEELAAAEEGNAEKVADVGTVINAAQELSSDGLRRSADTLAELPQTLRRPWQAFVHAAFDVFSDEWDMLRRRLQSTDLMEQRWVGLQAQATRQATQLWRQARVQWRQRSAEALTFFRFGRRQARRLIQRGQSVVGVLSQGEDAQLDTIDAIANVGQLLARLPLVYRKLFSFEPVTLPSLLEGRRRDLARVRAHYNRWREGQPAGALVLAMTLGSGRTSFLNVARITVFEDAEVRTITLHERLADADAFAARVADALGINSEQPTLDALERQIRDLEPGERPRVCLIDNLEHLLLQAPGGSDLLERVLIFLSRTDSQVFWMATMGRNSWHFLERTAGAASGLVTAYKIDPFDREAVKAILINRHRRSGMPLRFADPADPPPLLRRRLHRARTPEERQEILQEEYFERLYRLCGQNVMLALFYWLRSADFASESGTLVMRPPKGLDFGFLAGFDLARAFTLKAFILHATLTLEEHNRIFRMTDDQSIFLLESLFNLRVIEPASGGEQVEASGPIVSGVRYRISPLLIHPVLELLRARHIVY